MDYAASILAKLPKRKRAIGLDRLLEQIEAYLPAEQVARIMEAYHFSAAAHEGQRRRSGEPYISHPVAVATILAELRMDAAKDREAQKHMFGFRKPA